MKSIRKIVFFGILIFLHSVLSFSSESQNLQVSAIRIQSKILDEERTISVSVPQDYETSPESYPVLVVLDAEGPKTFPGCVGTVKDLNTRGITPEMIIVGIWNTVRNRDMIPEAVSHRPESGGSEKFLSFIREEMLPEIQQHYRTTGYSLLYGMSNSALFAVYALLESPDAFDAYIASSPMIGHCPEYIQKKTEGFITKKDAVNRVLFMIYGTNDTDRVTKFVPKFQDFLIAHAPKGFKSQLEILDGEGHVPESSLARGLQYIFSEEIRIE